MVFDKQDILYLGVDGHLLKRLNRKYREICLLAKIKQTCKIAKLSLPFACKSFVPRSAKKLT